MHKKTEFYVTDRGDFQSRLCSGCSSITVVNVWTTGLITSAHITQQHCHCTQNFDWFLSGL